MTERTAVLESRLLDLDEQLRARANAETQDRARSFAALTDTIDRRTILDVMDAASGINALDRHSWTGRSGRITVPAGEGFDAPRIAIEYAMFDEDNWNSEDVPLLRLSVIGMEDESVVWDEDDDAVQVFAEIRQMMIRRGEARRTGPLSPMAFFKNFSEATQEATWSRSGSPEGWVTDTPVLEMVEEDWMITNNGIEVRDLGIVIRRDQYPHNVPGQERTGYSVGSAPDHLDSSTWECCGKGTFLFHRPGLKRALGKLFIRITILSFAKYF
ncbi:hypothetical protein SAMN06296378_2089 [Salinibacterium xinjiangense]|uniref:Uncharacterized protein n=1 Tax=Salinibacterium xinjiangense TaxID=386302 RepID=A0A2C8ZVT6_9MICO|nr:hypothetical protein [Salinibacterium xinjiangense]SOE69907.1 hypothetical protein SAMN06296378_2089 [Salinibacterium xinjiangense]